MVSTFYNPGKTTADEINPWNNLLGKALQSYNAMTMAKYLPEQQEADIFHKRISPLANIAISPVFSALEPQAQQQISNYISNALSSQQQQPQKSPIDAIKSLFGGPSAPQAATGQQYQQTPSTSMRQNIVEKLNARQAAPGSTIISPEGSPVSSIPTSSTTEGTQSTLTAYEELEPRIQALAALSKKFPGDLITKFDVAKDKAISGPLADEYKSFKSLQKEIKPYLKKLGYSDADAEDVLKVGAGEKNYAQRLKSFLHRLEDTVKRSKKREGGISLINEEAPSKSIDEKIARDNAERTRANKVSSAMNLRKMSTEELKQLLASMQ
jgi:hypothetical protein